MMLVYFKNRHGQVTEIDVEPQETIREVAMEIEELKGVEKVRIFTQDPFFTVLKF